MKSTFRLLHRTFVAVGWNGVVLTCANGLRSSKRDAATMAQLWSITCRNNDLLADMSEARREEGLIVRTTEEKQGIMTPKRAYHPNMIRELDEFILMPEGLRSPSETRIPQWNYGKHE